jgi:hypothetical protein
MDNARQRVNQTTVDIMRSSRLQQPGAGMPGQYGMPQQVVPLFIVFRAYYIAGRCV